jgi:hypothetical protein
MNVYNFTLGYYVEAKAGYQDVKWPVKTDYLLASADCQHWSWTGGLRGREGGKRIG